MTVVVERNRNVYMGNGSTVVFPFTFKIFFPSDLRVEVNDVVVVTGYKVNGVGTDNGGNVTFMTAPASGQKIVIALHPPLLQDLGIEAVAPFHPTAIMSGMDKLVNMVKILGEMASRTAKAPGSSSVEDYLGSDSGVAAAFYLRSRVDGLGFEAIASIVDASGNLSPSGAGAVTRTVASKLSDIVSVKDFGAQGDGVTDDSTAINAAIRASNYIFFPAGLYRCNNPIQIFDNNAGGNRRGIYLHGVNGGASGGSLRCVLEWSGAGSTTPFIQIYSRDCVIDGFAIRCASGTVVPALVDIDASSGPGAGACSNISLRQCYITQGLGAATDGVRIGNTAQANCEYHTLYDTYIDGVRVNCLNLVGANGQSKHNAFYRSSFGFAAVGINQVRGSFRAYLCAFGHLSASAIMLRNSTDQITIADTDSEWCNRFLDTGGPGPVWPVTIRGGRLDTTGMNADGEYIRFLFGGPLLIENVTFGAGAFVAAFKIRAHANDPGAVVVLLGNAFPNTTPYYTDLLHRQRVIALGNMGLTSGSVMAHVPDQIMQFVVSSNTVGLQAFPQRRVVTSYGAMVAIDMTAGNEFDITVTNSRPFTIGSPTQVTTPDGQRITITVRNTSGSAVGVVTWDAAYKLAAWTSPATGFSRSIDFRFDGTNWVEISRTPDDVPN